MMNLQPSASGPELCKTDGSDGKTIAPRALLTSAARVIGKWFWKHTEDTAKTDLSRFKGIL